MPELAIIFSFILAVVVITAVTIHRIVARVYQHKEWRELQRSSARDAASSEQYRKLEERVRVLERIATDGNHALASQIEQLRELDAIDALAGTRETQR
ncbi:MAG TPA: hypothetical protein VFX62_05320 [Erythrobacter sp.]|nr:hypothetical protein [Erythrobacter sp.]